MHTSSAQRVSVSSQGFVILSIGNSKSHQLQLQAHEATFKLKAATAYLSEDGITPRL